MIIRRFGLVAAAFLVVAPVSAIAQRAQPMLLPDDGWDSALMAPAAPMGEAELILPFTRVDSIRSPERVLPLDDPEEGYSLERYVAVGAGLGALGAAIWTGVSLLRHDGQYDDGFYWPYMIGFPIAVGAAAGGTLGFLLWLGGEATPER